MIQIAPRFRALRILCVEEEEVQRKLFQACADVIGAECLFAENATKAMWLFRRHPVDMVFIDIDRHCAQELAAFQAMRALPGRGHRVPIVAVTNNDCRWTAENYREAGFAALFAKPLEPTRLFQAIDDLLCETGQPPLLLAPVAEFRNPQFA
jgi:CheY-like chemotaxis protein